jgi:hypothetical protein
MTQKTFRAFSALMALALGSSIVNGQSAPAPKLEFPAASPSSTLKQRVGLTDFEIVYSRPGVKGRQIWGAMEAYGKVWRTGANSATKITFTTPVKFNGVEAPAGTYALFTIPDPKEWTIILNRESDQWGAYRYNESLDVLRVKVKAETLPKVQETFSITFEDIRDEAALLVLAWENLRVPIPIGVEVESKLIPQIEAAMASPEKKSAGVYFSSAQFYLEHGQDLNKALAWANEAVTLSPKAHYMVHVKAKILAKLGRKEEAIATAKESIALAEAAKDLGYVKLNNDLISSLK